MTITAPCRWIHSCCYPPEKTDDDDDKFKSATTTAKKEPEKSHNHSPHNHFRGFRDRDFYPDDDDNERREFGHNKHRLDNDRGRKFDRDHDLEK